MDNPAALLEGLDADQAEIVQQLRGPVCIVAGPGSGKTRVVSHRIAYGVATGFFDEGKVLALTYTNRAAAELRSRLRSLGVTQASVRTFHSAALAQLQFFWPQLTDSQAPKLITGKKQLFSDAGLTDAQLSELIGAIDYQRYSLSEFSPESFHGLQSLSAERAFELASNYHQQKMQRKLMDWEDVLVLCAGLMRSEPRMLEHFQQQYRFFTVDEYQDISPLQQALLTTWLGERDSLCVVGDPRQTIYSFAGASSRFLTGFELEHPEGQTFTLKRNYRSAVEIVEYANSILASDLEPVRSLSSKPKVKSFDSASEEAIGTASEIKKALSSGILPEEIAVLARNNAQLEVIESALSQQGIPVQVRGSGRFFARPEVTQAMLAVRALGVTGSEQPLFAQISDIIAALGWRSSGSGDKWWALNWFLEVLDELGEPSLAEYQRELQERERSGHEPQAKAVTLATIHATKGLEWAAVFLIGVNQGVFPTPHAKTELALGEERRLFFVAVTRAKDRLQISYSTDRGPSELLRQ